MNSLRIVAAGAFIVLVAAAIGLLLLTRNSARVVAITDGDTIKVLRDGKQETIRLHGVDCPEGGQPFGTRAKQFTSSLAFGKRVKVIVRDRDRYGRTVAEVVLPNGRSLNRELVRSGLAWHFKRYSDDPVLAQLETQARAARLGLWADQDPIPPWDWRHNGRPR